MLKKCLALSMIVGWASLMTGCSEEKEQTPIEKWGADTQSVRLKIFRDGTVTRALNAYKMNSGVYPTTEQGLDALVKRPAGLDPKAWQGPYIDDAELIDMWGNKLRYACPGKAFPDKTDRFDLWSTGPDGQDQSGAPDDILNHNVR